MSAELSYPQKPGYPEKSAYPAAPMQPPVAIQRFAERPWHYGLCTCCGECGACMESWCCQSCQLSRQYNYINNQKAEIDLGVCCAIYWVDACCPFMFLTRFCAYSMRRDIRKKYGIEGDDCCDCCIAFWCWCCSTQQVSLEMTSCNECPGSCCDCITSTTPGTYGDMA